MLAFHRVPLMDHFYLNDSVFFLNVIFLSNYADDNDLYCIGENHNIIKNLLRKVLGF